MAYEYVRSIAGDNPKLKIIYERLERVLIGKMEEMGLVSMEVPLELEYIVEEETLVLFNRIGSEGVKMERVGSGGTTVDYGESEYRVFSIYEEDILRYVNSKVEGDYGIDVSIDFI